MQTQSEQFNLSQMQKCTCDFLYPVFDLCGGEA
ncbi:hypothetical protein [Citrobacter freundii]